MSSPDKNPGDMGHSGSHTYRVTSNLAGDLGIREGQVLRARVDSRLPNEDNKIIIQIKGNRVVAASELNVEDDQILLVKVESLGRPIELSLFDAESVDESFTDDDYSRFLEQRGFSGSSRNIDVVKALLEKSLPLNDTFLQSTLSDVELLTDDNNAIDPDKVWSYCFLKDNQLPVSGDLVDLLGGVDNVDLNNVWNAYFSRTLLPGGTSNVDLKSAVRAVGFDCVRRFGKRPHEASQTIHAQLLKELKDSAGSTSSNYVNRKTLGSILGVALKNLSRLNTFVFFAPVVFQGETQLIWFGVSLGNEEPMDWKAHFSVTLNALGEIGISVNKSRNKIIIEFRTDSERTLEVIKSASSILEKKLQTDELDVILEFNKEAAPQDLEVFEIRSKSNTGQNNLPLGLDLTI